MSLELIVMRFIYISFLNRLFPRNLPWTGCGEVRDALLMQTSRDTFLYGWPGNILTFATNPTALNSRGSTYRPIEEERERRRGRAKQRDRRKPARKVSLARTGESFDKVSFGRKVSRAAKLASVQDWEVRTVSAARKKRGEARVAKLDATPTVFRLYVSTKYEDRVYDT